MIYLYVLFKRLLDFIILLGLLYPRAHLWWAPRIFRYYGYYNRFFIILFFILSFRIAFKLGLRINHSVCKSNGKFLDSLFFILEDVLLGFL